MDPCLQQHLGSMRKLLSPTHPSNTCITAPKPCPLRCRISFAASASLSVNIPLLSLGPASQCVIFLLGGPDEPGFWLDCSVEQLKQIHGVWSGLDAALQGRHADLSAARKSRPDACCASGPIMVAYNVRGTNLPCEGV